MYQQRLHGVAFGLLMACASVARGWFLVWTSVIGAEYHGFKLLSNLILMSAILRMDEASGQRIGTYCICAISRRKQIRLTSLYRC